MTDDRDLRHRRSGRPLLSLASEPPAADAPGDALSHAEMHRRARSRRNAAPSPLVEALAHAPESVAPPSDSTRDKAVRPSVSRQDGRHSPGTHHDPVAQAGAYRDETPARAHRPYRTPASAGDGADQPERLWQPLIDVETVVRSILRARWLIAGTTLAGAGLAALIALSTPHTYTASTQILVDPREVKVVGKDLTPGFLANEAVLAMIDSQVQVLRSTTVLRKVVDRTGLSKDPEFNGSDTGALSSLVEGVRTLVTLFQATGQPDDPMAKTIENLREAIWVNRANRTFVLDIEVTSESAEKSALLANELTRVFMEEQATQSTSLAGQATEALSGRLEELRKAVEADEQAVEEYKAANGLIGVQGRLTDEDDLISLNAQLSKARGETLAAKVRAEAARGAGIDQILAGDLPEAVTSLQLSELRTQYVQIKQEADVIGRSYGPRHPRNIDAQSKVAAVRDELQAELRRIAQSAQAAYRSAVQTEQELAQSLAALKARQVTNGEALVELRERQRKADASRAVYESFLLSARETGELKDISTSNMRVISDAEPPLKPSSPSRKLTVIAGGAGGFALGLGLAALGGIWQSLTGRGGPAGGRRTLTPEAPGSGGGQGLRSWLPFGRRPDAATATSTTETNTDQDPESDMPPYDRPVVPPYHAYPQGPAQPAPAWGVPQQGVYGQPPAAYPPAPWPMPHPAAQYPAWPQPEPVAPTWPQAPAQWGGPQPPAWAYQPAYPAPYPPDPRLAPQAAWPVAQPWAPTAPPAPPAQAFPQAAPPAAYREPDHPSWRRTEQPAVRHADPVEDEALDDLRQSLREVRDAVEALAGRRQNRRFG